MALRNNKERVVKPLEAVRRTLKKIELSRALTHSTLFLLSAAIIFSSDQVPANPFSNVISDQIASLPTLYIELPGGRQQIEVISVSETGGQVVLMYQVLLHNPDGTVSVRQDTATLNQFQQVPELRDPSGIAFLDSLSNWIEEQGLTFGPTQHVLPDPRQSSQ